MLASVRSLRGLQPKLAARALAARSSAVPALALARQRTANANANAGHGFATAQPRSASQAADTFMNGTNASYAQAQFEAWQEASRSSPSLRRRFAPSITWPLAALPDRSARLLQSSRGGTWIGYRTNPMPACRTRTRFTRLGAPTSKALREASPLSRRSSHRRASSRRSVTASKGPHPSPSVPAARLRTT